jgi:transposase
MYDHYIGLDWAEANMAVARMTRHSDEITVIDVPSDVKELKLFLGRINGKKILTFEETTTSQWLYTELQDYVDEILVCDPVRNKLLSEGPKTDKIDAKKLVQLLKTNLLKPVFHSGSEFIKLRKLISGYEDVVKNGVRSKNQKSALFRAKGKNKKNDTLEDPDEKFVSDGLDRWIGWYEKEKKLYENEFAKIAKGHKLIRNLKSIPGIGLIGAVRLAAIVVDADRFKNKGSWLSYCGLINLERMSGGRSYGRKKPRYCRAIKYVFKLAALTALKEKNTNPFRQYYLGLLEQPKYSEEKARQALARRIAVVTLGVFRSNKEFKNKWRCVCKKTEQR